MECHCHCHDGRCNSRFREERRNCHTTLVKQELQGMHRQIMSSVLSNLRLDFEKRFDSIAGEQINNMVCRSLDVHSQWRSEALDAKLQEALECFFAGVYNDVVEKATVTVIEVLLGKSEQIQTLADNYNKGRRCSLCEEVGHTKAKCPLRDKFKEASDV